MGVEGRYQPTNLTTPTISLPRIRFMPFTRKPGHSQLEELKYSIHFFYVMFRHDNRCKTNLIIVNKFFLDNFHGIYSFVFLQLHLKVNKLNIKCCSDTYTFCNMHLKGAYKQTKVSINTFLVLLCCNVCM